MELLFTGEFPPCPGGISNFMYVRCLHPPRDGLRVLAAGWNGSAAWDAVSGVPVTRFAYRHGGSLLPGVRRAQQVWRAGQAIDGELRRRKYRLITANLLFPFGSAAVDKKKTHGHRVAVFCHGAELLRAKLSATARWLYRKTMPKVDKYVANSVMTADVLASHGWNRRRICVIPCPVDSSRFHPGIDGSKLREEWLSGGLCGPVLLTVSRLDDIGKGIDVMIQVVAKLRRRFPGILYVIAGSGPLRATYEKAAQELGVTRHVLFAGYVADEELPFYYAACDLFVLLSRIVPDVGYYEGFGIVYREAMACGKPVIVSREAGFHDYVTHGEDGLVVDPRDAHAVAGACEDILSDASIASEMGKRAVRFALSEPDWSPLNELA